MNRVLRSMIDIDESLSQENMRVNYFSFQEYKIGFLLEPDELIYKYIQDFFAQSKDADLPSYQSILDYFTSESRIDVIDRLEEIKASPSYIRSNFKRLCETLYQEHQSRSLDTLLRESSVIKSSGLKIGGKKGVLKKGVRDAVEHFIAGSDSLLTVQSKGKLKGDIVADGEEVIAEYQRQKADPKVGRLTGLRSIDHYTKGLRPGELMLILGYVGELKTTMAINYAYNTAIHYGWNVMYFSLEMKYEHMRNIFYTIHSTHEKFQRRNGKLRYIDYGRLRDGELTPEEEVHLQEVVKDFAENEGKAYGRVIVERPTGDITVPEIKLKAEVEHRKNELGLLIIDHAGLVENDQGRSVNNYGMSLNYVLKDLTKLALNFNDGEGIPICVPFQANREGWKEACKSEGAYKLSALSWANEAERSAAFIMYTFLGDTPELRDRGETKIGCLKSRDGAHFPQFAASIHFQTRRIRNPVDQEDTSETLKELGL